MENLTKMTGNRPIGSICTINRYFLMLIHIVAKSLKEIAESLLVKRLNGESVYWLSTYAEASADKKGESLRVKVY
jgi:hypothetical protein